MFQTVSLTCNPKYHKHCIITLHQLPLHLKNCFNPIKLLEYHILLTLYSQQTMGNSSSICQKCILTLLTLSFQIFLKLQVILQDCFATQQQSIVFSITGSGQKIDPTKIVRKNTYALRDFVPFVQFKKLEKHPWRSVIFNKVAS